MRGGQLGRIAQCVVDHLIKRGIAEHTPPPHVDGRCRDRFADLAPNIKRFRRHRLDRDPLGAKIGAPDERRNTQRGCESLRHGPDSSGCKGYSPKHASFSKNASNLRYSLRNYWSDRPQRHLSEMTVGKALCR
ncbi:hypothetical protein BN2475_240054 [Paraburkholderia ribeironis]|uniref:Uncharacterized protein n=1 Tax=Paraburkholderia ribeironis TaxID=1247936 RepID=A0A1N7RY78_9BURK|nr:hypothetical protein BN2475_240054 [Paraburkholderia ribeironis]